MKIGTAGLMHETHTFLPGKTDLEPFEETAVRGEEIIETLRGTNTAMGGFIEVSDAKGIVLEPIVHATGGISGTVTDDVYETYVREMRDGFTKIADDIDGIVLFLHGAMVTESRQDPEWDIIREIRGVVGDELPIVVAMDLHGNISPGMVDDVTAICSYQSSPHVDKHETGVRAINLLIKTISNEVTPTMAISKPGLAIPSPFSATTVSPAKDIVTRGLIWQIKPELHDVTCWDLKQKVLDVSFFFGFAWSDVRQMGASAVVVTDDDQEFAERISEDLTDFAWSNRKSLTAPDELYSVEGGVKRAISRAETATEPILVLDAADRLAETTFVLRELLEQGARGAAVPLLYDPETVQQCLRAGEGSEVTLQVGSKASHRGGGPVEVTGTVAKLENKRYTATGPMTSGQRVDNGPTAILYVDDIWVQITSNRDTYGLIDTDPLEQYGYSVTDFNIIVSKSKTHFRAVYEDLADEIVIVDAPEYSPVDLGAFEYKHAANDVYPLRREVDDV